jgi:hypothetical protein
VSERSKTKCYVELAQSISLLTDMRARCLLIVLLLIEASLLRGAENASSAAQPSPREAAIADFAGRMRAANYPALFEQAANEFNVPADLLKAVAFAETRWEHLTWPPGETASPDTGMPRPYGIMSLWDNKYFGHSLLEAAKLIGQDPEVLKQNPLQNMRGAAALLRKLYDENPKPSDSSEIDLESWRYAVRKYCGIPEPDLNARHVLEVYTFMNQGYHQYGIEWNGRKVNLEPIRQETMRIMADEEKRREANLASGSNGSVPPPVLSAEGRPASELSAQRVRGPSSIPTVVPGVESHSTTPSTRSTLWFIGGALLTLAAISIATRKAPGSN